MAPASRRLASAALNAAWERVCAAGVIGPDDARGRRFRHMGEGSAIGFPPGDLFGEAWISIGAGTLILSGVTLSAGIPGIPLDPGHPEVISIGGRCSIGRGCFIVGLSSIAIGDDVTIAPRVYITDHNHSYEDTNVPIGRQWPSEAPVSIGPGCWLGTGAVILPGAQLGANVAVAAGSVVRGVVPDHCVVAGSPARVVRQHDPQRGWVPPPGPRVVREPPGWQQAISGRSAP